MIRLSFEGEQQLEMKNDSHFDLIPEWKMVGSIEAQQLCIKLLSL